MTKTSVRDAGNRPQLMRNRIAARAARLMAEDGIADFSLAKRKAARQLGAPSTQALPNNDEIELELKAYRELYQAGQHDTAVEQLRRKALSAMRFFAKFDPYLTGPVLSGSAGPYSTINLELFAANEKELSLFLLDRRIKFEIAEDRHFHKKQREMVCTIRVEWEGIPLHLALYEPVDRRGALGTSGERAGVATVERLLRGAAPPDPE